MRRIAFEALLRRRLTPADLLLYDVVRRFPSLEASERTERLLSITPGQQVVAAARFHGLAPLLHLVTRGEGLPHSLANPLIETYTVSLANHLRALVDLALLATEFDDAGICWLVMKGPVLSELYYPRPDMRPYADLDVLVDPRHFGDALQRLESVGAVVLTRDWDAMLRAMRAEVSLRLPHGTLLDLHWHVFNRRHVRNSFHIDTHKLLEGRRSVRVGGAAAYRLDDNDTVVHLCTHALLSGGQRLLWYLDIGQVAARAVPGQVGARAAEWGAVPIVRASLARASAVRANEWDPTRFDLPGWPTMWGLGLQLVDLLWPPRTPRTGTRSGRAFLESTRPTTLTSVGAFLGRTLRSRSWRLASRDLRSRDRDLYTTTVGTAGR